MRHIFFSDAFQSTPSVWRETHLYKKPGHFLAISIHSLRVEGDRQQSEGEFAVSEFQSTPSVWRETGHPCGKVGHSENFNPLPPCGGRPIPPTIVIAMSRFQSTPSVWRETVQSVADCLTKCNFNPLPPCGGRHTCVGSVSGD